MKANGVIQRKLALLDKLIVHQYEEIDPEILYSIVSKKLDDFRRFRDEIDKL